MVDGIEKFIEKFKDYSDCYTVIGGAACDILMKEADTPFRRTKDIDIILIMEDRHEEFAKVFWEYIREGGYRCGWGRSNTARFYRFTEPKAGYPIMIELFSKKPDYKLEIEEGIVPIHISDEISSLSAILLNDDFYSFMLQGRIVVMGVTVLRPEYLIPFKMYAWLNLRERKLKGEHVNDTDLKKHKNDIFRLVEIVTEEMIYVEGFVKDTIQSFFEQIENEEVYTEAMRLPYSKEQGIEKLKRIYQGDKL